VVVHQGCILGTTGFGHVKNAEGDLVQFPHIGGLTIEDDVEIGAGAVVDRGALSDTIIRRGAKLGAGVHVAHNSELGSRVIMASQAKVCGSVSVGESTWLAPGSVVRDGVTVGANCVVGLGGIVTKNVPDNTTVFGVPARPLRQPKPKPRAT